MENWKEHVNAGRKKEFKKSKYKKKIAWTKLTGLCATNY